MPSYIFNLNPNPATLLKPAHHEVHRESPYPLNGVLSGINSLAQAALYRDCPQRLIKAEHIHRFYAENDAQAMDNAKGLAAARGRIADGCFFCMNKDHNI